MKNKSYLIIAVATLIAFTVAGTYAFFQILGGNTEERNVSVQTYTSDSLSFNVTKDIEIEASRENFYQNAGNLSDTTTATARLVPNSRTNTATEHYNVYVVIDSNNFVYTTEAHTPELLLTISSPSGTINSITGLNNVSNGVFDITTRTGAFLVAEDYEISASTAQGTTQTWTMTVTLVNLNTDQNNNTGKTLTGTIYMTKEDLTTYSLAELNSLRTNNNITHNSITVEAVTTTGSENLSTYYFGIEEGNNSTGYIQIANQTINGIEFFESSTNSYTFTNLKDNTDYTVYSFVEDAAGFKSNIYSTTIKTAEYNLPSVTNVTTEVLDLHSIKLTATSQAGDNAVSKYLFNCGSGWSSPQDSNIYTCSGLTYNTNYTFKVKVLDTYGKYSLEYDKPSVISNYQITCSAGTYLAAGSETCVACPAGSYCPGGTHTYDNLAHGATLCSQGSYSTGGASVCTACVGGKTNSGTGNTAACTTTCSNNTNVSTWETPTWTANSVSNLCTINACATNYEVSGTSCVSSITYKYWNAIQGGNETVYASNSYPSSAKNSYTELNLSTFDKFIKTKISGTTAISHETCMYYNGKVFCMAPNYWTGTIGTMDNTAALNTKNKLQTDINNSLNLGSSLRCYYTSTNGYCDTNDYGRCQAWYDGKVNCGNRPDGVNYASCFVLANGKAYCSYCDYCS